MAMAQVAFYSVGLRGKDGANALGACMPAQLLGAALRLGAAVAVKAVP